MKIVIADASCLIALDNINEIDLLQKLYQQIIVTPQVADEVGESLPGWVDQISSTNTSLIEQLSKSLELGEATSIALALEISDCLLIIDEKKGRREAKKRGINVTGTFGIVMQGIDQGLIKDPDTIIKRIQMAGFWISEILKDEMRSKLR